MIVHHCNRTHKLPNYIIPKVVTSVATHDNHCIQVWVESQNVLAQLCTYLRSRLMVLLVSQEAKNI